ncbi:MAG: hypothetical protein V3U67_03315, partial [Gemmatimonadota bacterium]
MHDLQCVTPMVLEMLNRSPWTSNSGEHADTPSRSLIARADFFAQQEKASMGKTPDQVPEDKL